MVDYTLPLDQLPDPLPIEPLQKPFDVTITPPGSKSITCRAYVLAALADSGGGESKIIRPLRAEDTEHLLNALCTLGAEARWVPGEGHDGEDVYIKGVGGRFPRGGNLYMGDGGAPTRFMIACACLAAEPVTIDASPRMRERPIAEGVEMLRQLGARIEYVEQEGRLPVRVTPSETLSGGEIAIGTTASSQFISAIMLIAPFLVNGLRLRFLPAPTSGSYVQLTIQMLDHFRVRCRRNLASRFSSRAMRRISIPSCQVRGSNHSVEVDASSTLYWVLATLAVRQSTTFVRSLPVWSRQPDLGAIYALHGFGAITLPWELNGGDDGIGSESDLPGSRRSRNIHCEQFPDGSIAIAAATCLTQRGAKLTGLRTLRVKETDRIAALANELRKVGCSVETGEDWISIEPPARAEAPGGGVVLADRREPRGADAAHSSRGSAGAVPRHPDDPVIIETYNDHRMAMAFAVLGLARPGILIRNPKCVAKSYPTFWKDFAKLYQ